MYSGRGNNTKGKYINNILYTIEFIKSDVGIVMRFKYYNILDKIP